jgi:hypothetical protein
MVHETVQDTDHSRPFALAFLGASFSQGPGWSRSQVFTVPSLHCRSVG